jgi:hypothetical protein
VARKVLDLAKANPDKPLAEIAKEFNETNYGGKKIALAGTTDEFNPVKVDFAAIVDSDPATVPSIGTSEELVADLMRIKKGELGPRVYNPTGSRSFFVVRLKDRKETKPDEDSLKGLFETLLRFKKVATYRGWYAALKTQAIKTGKLVEHEAFIAMLQQQIKARQEEMKRRGRSLRMKLHDINK